MSQINAFGWSLQETTHPDGHKLWGFVLWKSEDPDARGVGDGEPVYYSTFLVENQAQAALLAQLVHRAGWLLSRRSMNAVATIRAAQWNYITEPLVKAAETLGRTADIGIREGCYVEDGLPEDRWFIEVVKEEP